MFIYFSTLIILCVLANLLKNKWKLTLIVISVFIFILYILLSLTHLNMAKFNLIWTALYFLLYPFLFFILNIKIANKTSLLLQIPITIISVILYIFLGIYILIIGLILSTGPLQEYYFNNTPVSSVKFTTIGDDILGGKILMTLYDQNEKQIGFEEVFPTGNAQATLYYNEIAICAYDNGSLENSYDINELKLGNIKPSNNCDSVMENGIEVVVAGEDETPTIIF